MVRATKFDFTTRLRPLSRLEGGCNRSASCHSDTAHYEHCPKLQADLDRFKAERRAYYAAGGYHGKL